jgi:hypothetical protein
MTELLAGAEARALSRREGIAKAVSFRRFRENRGWLLENVSWSDIPGLGETFQLERKGW